MTVASGALAVVLLPEVGFTLPVAHRLCFSFWPHQCGMCCGKRWALELVGTLETVVANILLLREDRGSGRILPTSQD